MRPMYWPVLAQAAEAFGLEAPLVDAQVMVESGGMSLAWNPEPHYRYLVNVRTGHPFRALTAVELASETPPADFPVLAGDRDQEWWAQQASWGLMQVMGAVARELGCKEPYLTALLEPTMNLQFGCRLLRQRLEWAKGDVRRGLAAYNAGPGGADGAAGQAYAERVLAMRRSRT